jgi:hypothetical protein
MITIRINTSWSLLYIQLFIAVAFLFRKYIVEKESPPISDFTLCVESPPLSILIVHYSFFLLLRLFHGPQAMYARPLDASPTAVVARSPTTCSSCKA